jgi:hypothetical protein
MDLAGCKGCVASQRQQTDRAGQDQGSLLTHLYYLFTLHFAPHRKWMGPRRDRGSAAGCLWQEREGPALMWINVLAISQAAPLMAAKASGAASQFQFGRGCG